MGRILRPELDVGRTLEKICSLLDEYVDDRTEALLKGDLNEGEYKGMCGYITAFRETKSMIMDAFTVDNKDSD
jgi:hypothetical protein